ncbi:hypothetical protein SEA_GIBBLES_93 [Gordonia phage Gibbles]|nr:hypothetical protein SEA_GIBBLES_93 [Gordonia phage Gibbles]
MGRLPDPEEFDLADSVFALAKKRDIELDDHQKKAVTAFSRGMNVVSWNRIYGKTVVMNLIKDVMSGKNA